MGSSHTAGFAKLFAVLFVSVVTPTCSSSNQSSTGPTHPPAAKNQAPVIGNLNVSPLGMGIVSATIFTFTGQGISDPDGDALTYAWVSSDGLTITSNTQAASHVYSRSGTFDMRLNVTDSKGLSTSASVSVRIGTVSGIWDVTCDNHPPLVIRLYPSFPSLFVVSMTQSGRDLFGTIAGGGLSQTFPSPGVSAGGVNDPKRVSFGVETFYNVWAPRDGDFYFGLTADDTLSTMSSTAAGNYCGSSVARRR